MFFFSKYQTHIFETTWSELFLDLSEHTPSNLTLVGHISKERSNYNACDTKYLTKHSKRKQCLDESSNLYTI